MPAASTLAKVATPQHVKRLIYTTPNALLVKMAKVFSLSTLTLSSISTPALLYFWESPAVQATGINEYMFMTETTCRYIVLNYLVAALAASTLSTGSLHFLLSPFVSSIYLHTPSTTLEPSGNMGINQNVNKASTNHSPPPPQPTHPKDTITPKTTITLETMDIFARPKYTTVQLGDLKPTTRFLLTWTCTPKYLARHPDTSPGRFLLDMHGGVGDLRQIVNVIQQQNRRQRTL